MTQARAGELAAPRQPLLDPLPRVAPLQAMCTVTSHYHYLGHYYPLIDTQVMSVFVELLGWSIVGASGRQLLRTLIDWDSLAGETGPEKYETRHCVY